MDKPKFKPVPAEAAGVFLGSVPCTYDHLTRAYDLYYLPVGNAPEPTLSARYSDTDADYMSGLVFGWQDDRPGHPLVVARVLAEARGLDCRRAYYAGKMIRGEDGVLRRRASAAAAVPATVVHVTVSGLRGSGKTTIAKVLRDALRRAGYGGNVEYIEPDDDPAINRTARPADDRHLAAVMDRGTEVVIVERTVKPEDLNFKFKDSEKKPE